MKIVRDQYLAVEVLNGSLSNHYISFSWTAFKNDASQTIIIITKYKSIAISFFQVDAAWYVDCFILRCYHLLL